MAKLAYNELTQFLDGNGAPYSGAQLFTYEAGSSTKETTYQDSGSVTPNSNPIDCDANGRIPYAIWLTEGQAYKFILSPSTDTDPPVSPIWTLDNITGINDVAEATLNEWVSGPTPTYIGATSFSLVGDQTTAFNVGRRLKSTNSGGTIYSTITASAFGALTTVTVENDSGTLDAGLSAVSYGIISAANSSIPVRRDVIPAIADVTDPTKRIRIDAGSITTGNTRILTMSDDDVSLAAATSSARGTVELASQAEIDAGTATTALSADTNRLSLGAVATTTSGSNHSWTVPAGVRRVTLNLSGVSISGTDFVIVQIGPVAGVETTGYLSTGTYLDNAAAVAGTNVTTSFQITPGANAANIHHGSVVFTLLNSATNTWAVSGSTVRSNSPSTFLAGGSKALAGVLSVLTLDTNGTDTFDAGVANVVWEK